MLVVVGLAALGSIGELMNRTRSVGTGQESTSQVTTESANSEESSDPADFGKLDFTVKPLSEDLDQDGRQQFAFTFTNRSHKNFVGTVVIRALDAAGRQVDSDILGPTTIGADGGSVRAASWFEKPFAIRNFTEEPRGTFHSLRPVTATVPFEQLSVVGGENVFIYTASRDSVAIWKVAQVYKARYAAQNRLAIEFFHDKQKAARHFPMSDAALSVLTAAYELNRTSGFEQLHMVR